MDDLSELERIATKLTDAADLYREARDLLEDPELRACFAQRGQLRDALSRRLREGVGAEKDPAGSFLPTASRIALKLRALVASGEYAALTSVYEADEQVLTVICDYLGYGKPSGEAQLAVTYVRDALIADRGPPEHIPLAPRRQPG
jgi:hypothetical protein